MTTLWRAEDEPVASRRDYWQHVVGDQLVPYELRDADNDFRSQMHSGDVGGVRVLHIESPPAMQVIRTLKLIRKSDPDLCKIDVMMRGEAVFEQDGRESRLGPGDFHFIDLTRPHRVTGGSPYGVAVVTFPRALLSLGRQQTRDLTAVRFAEHETCATLVSSMIRTVVAHLDAYERAGGARLGTAMLDLLTATLATRLGRQSEVPYESRERTLVLRIQAFIEQHLDDPDLCPAVVAAAHHISVRYLHKLFETQERTVAGWIRQRRLDQCRRELLDPALRARPVSAIGARWGIPDAAVFSRVFRDAYGVPPSEYRVRHAFEPQPYP